MLAVVKDIARFKAPRTFRTRLGVLNGYDPAKPGVVVKTATFANASPAAFDAVVSIDQLPDAGVTPHGAPFLHVTSGTFVGLYVVAAAVTADLTPDASDVTAVPNAVGATSARDAANAALDKVAGFALSLKG